MFQQHGFNKLISHFPIMMKSNSIQTKRRITKCSLVCRTIPINKIIYFTIKQYYATPPVSLFNLFSLYM